jgi:hypothetical protein
MTTVRSGTNIVDSDTIFVKDLSFHHINITKRKDEVEI